MLKVIKDIKNRIGPILIAIKINTMTISNLKRPDKNWTIGVEINGKWYSQAGFDELAENGEPTGIELLCVTKPEVEDITRKKEA